MRYTGKDFEELLLFRAKHMEEKGILTMNRYGVQVSMMPGLNGPEWKPIRSLPDFDASIAPMGREMIIEAKVASGSSYSIEGQKKTRPRQIEHMLKRARFGSLCFLVVHFNARDLVTKSEPARTYAFRIHPDSEFWREIDASERKSISRGTAELYGELIPWNLWSPRATKMTPDLSVLLK